MPTGGSREISYRSQIEHRQRHEQARHTRCKEGKSHLYGGGKTCSGGATASQREVDKGSGHEGKENGSGHLQESQSAPELTLASTQLRRAAGSCGSGLAFLGRRESRCDGLYQRARFCPLVALYFEVTLLYLDPISQVFCLSLNRLRSYASVT